MRNFNKTTRKKRGPNRINTTNTVSISICMTLNTYKFAMIFAVVWMDGW